jgi:hypothetical protein
MKQGRLLPTLFILILSVFGSLGTFPHVHAQLTGTVCIADPFATSCPSTPLAITALNGTQMEVAVNIQDSDSINGFDIFVKADPSILDSVAVNLAGSVLGQNILTIAKCTGNTGSGCTEGQNGPGTIRVAAVALGFITPSPTTGRLFSIVFNVTSTASSVVIGFQTGCSGTSTNSNFCVTVVNGYTLNREAVQESTGTPGDFRISATLCCAPVGRSATLFGGVDIQSLNGFFGSMTVSFTVSPLRNNGPTVFAFTTGTVLLLPSTSTTILFVFRTSSLTPPGNYTVIVRGKAGLIAQTGATSMIVTAPGLGAPSPPPTPILTGTPDLALGFNGLDNRDQRSAGTGLYNNTQFSHEPPDQALCVGSRYVIEAVNTVLQIFDRRGTALTPPTPLTQFLGLSPEVKPDPPRTVGTILSDPRCYYDQQTGRFYLTVLQIDVTPSGILGTRSHVEIAVSKTPDPRDKWHLFSLDLTDDGTNGTQSHYGCPCFGDQPLIGADSNGFYITTNEFSLRPTGAYFNGAQIYAMSKRALANGIFPTVVHIDAGSILTPPRDAAKGAVWSSIQPATSPAGNDYASSFGGTEYFLSSLDFNGTVDNRLAVWALSNTRSLNKPSPSVQLSLQIIPSELYGLPNPVVQRDGPAPLAAVLVEPLALIESNDDRMTQVIYSNGLLSSAVNTIIGREDVDTVGIAYFTISPRMTSPTTVTGNVINQGYVAPQDNNAMFPAVGVTSDGTGVIVFTLVGPDYYPSAAYSLLTTTGIDGVHIASPGSAPEDGFSGYPETGGNGVARWGDYSAAVSDNAGHMWIATEYIPNTPRTTFANWGTFIAKIDLR